MSKIQLINIEETEIIFIKAAEFLIKSMEDQLKSGSKLLLLLSGGSVINLYKKLAEYIRSANIKNDSLVVGQVDERFQPEISNYKIQISNKFQNPKPKLQFSKEDMNSYQIEKMGLWKACDMKNIPYYLISQEGTLGEATEKYDQTISKLFKEYSYRIAVLGIGEDGHTAGLLPGYEKAWNTDKLVVGYENNGEFKQRISLTPKTISQLDYGIVVAISEKKRKAIEKALDPVNGNNINKYPAVLLQKMKEVDLFTDIKPV